MYSLEDVNKCRDVIIRILRGTQREGIENVLAYMDENGFYSAAASCKFHNNFYGGLAKHRPSYPAMSEALQVSL